MDKSIGWNDFVVEELKYDEEFLNEYIKNSIQEFKKDKDIDKFIVAVKRIVEAKGGVTTISKRAGMSRQGLYDNLKEHGNPKIKTFERILEAVGLTIEIKPFKKYKYT